MNAATRFARLLAQTNQTLSSRFFLGCFSRYPRSLFRQFFSTPAVPNASITDCTTVSGQTQDNPAVLFIDSGKLLPDKNAGDVSLRDFITSFSSHGWKVYFWSCAKPSKNTRRDDTSRDSLRWLSANSTDEYFESWWRKHAQQFKIVILSRPSVALAFLPIVRKYGEVTVAYYGHDLHFLRLREESAVKGMRWLGWIAERYLRLERAVWRSVDISYYPSEHEVEVVRKLDPSVNVQYVPPYYFDLKNDGPYSLPSGTAILFVGNFIHSPNSDAVEWLVYEIWPLVRENSPASELIIVGSGMSDRLNQLCKTLDGVHVRGWVSDDELRQLYEQVRVVIAPLRFGAGVKHKVVAALAHSRPLVTTSIGMQGLDTLINEVIVAESAHEIATSCTRLLEDDELWMQYATAGRKAIADRFTRSAMWEAFSDLKAEEGVSVG